jgi:hypothetical protein
MARFHDVTAKTKIIFRIVLIAILAYKKDKRHHGTYEATQTTKAQQSSGQSRRSERKPQ